MESSPHLLVVDDHRDIRELLARYLREQGMRVTLAASGEELRRLMKTTSPDLVVLDIMMPGEDGLSLCRFLREHHASLPVILLTALGEDTDRIVGLEMGADDYLTKPFNPRELLARVKAVLRRTRQLPGESEQREGLKYHFADWVLDTDRRSLFTSDGVEVALSTAEFRLLLVFLRHPRRVLSRDQLLDLTAGREAQPFDRAIDNQVSRLRRKIEADTRNPALIKTVWGGGYQLNADVSQTGVVSQS
ncbi:response regulator [Marinospirillum alkaliphilum]|uniref:Two-component system, OmpR family, response regulator n=1 Tax=Marinospirillum alkaliphilum DSM 21637 TaxID=1122209 RepID=A0A1K1V5Y5_9GAMM|nr:response regulator [Marinospirillum alkaliphilum]SFX20546.1 two-component system, OmpR family, response regulator [Marinospirillum alkaliphilum DSM 21637]